VDSPVDEASTNAETSAAIVKHFRRKVESYLIAAQTAIDN